MRPQFFGPVTLLAIAVAMLPTTSRAQTPDWYKDVEAGAHAHFKETLLQLQQFAENKYSDDNGLIVAMGDSWFDYPGADILKQLRWRYHFRVEPTAHYGERLEGLAYENGQLLRLLEIFKTIHDTQPVDIPKAILLSGGGNDIADPDLQVILNHAASGMPRAFDTTIAQELIDIRLRAALVSLLVQIDDACMYFFGKLVPIIVHGYDFPIPDGRGFAGVGGHYLKGPWLENVFREKGQENRAANTNVMANLIDAYNVMLYDISSLPGLSHVRYVNLLGVLSADEWANELHPTTAGFAKLADCFAGAIPMQHKRYNCRQGKAAD